MSPNGPANPDMSEEVQSDVSVKEDMQEERNEKRRPITTTRVSYGQHQEFEEAQEVEFRVFLNKHYIDEPAEEDGINVIDSNTSRSHKVLEFAPFDEMSTFIVARNDQHE